MTSNTQVNRAAAGDSAGQQDAGSGGSGSTACSADGGCGSISDRDRAVCRAVKLVLRDAERLVGECDVDAANLGCDLGLSRLLDPRVRAIEESLLC